VLRVSVIVLMALLINLIAVYAPIESQNLLTDRDLASALTHSERQDTHWQLTRILNTRMGLVEARYCSWLAVAERWSLNRADGMPLDDVTEECLLLLLPESISLGQLAARIPQDPEVEEKDGFVAFHFQFSRADGSFLKARCGLDVSVSVGRDNGYVTMVMVRDQSEILANQI